MADQLITADLHGIEPSFPFSDIDPSIELINQYYQFNPSLLDYSCLNFENYMPFSNDNYFSNQEPLFQGNLEEIFPRFVDDHDNKRNQNEEAPAAEPRVVAGNEYKESKKRIAKDISKSSSETKRKNSSGRGKRVKRNEKKDDNPKEVVHVRARRGQATDSHSLAERVRRAKISEKLRCLRSIVPGCSQRMSMAVMLEEIINYVQCMQNQVELLSMKQTAESSFYYFNTKRDGIETMQRERVNYEESEMDTLMREGYGGFAG